MNYSRIDKFVREIRSTGSLAEASDMRNLPLTLVLGTDRTGKVGVMAVTAVALALRCLGGPIEVVLPATEAEAGELLTGVRRQIEQEAIRSGRPDRVTFVTGAASTALCFGVGTDVPSGCFADAAGWVSGINRRMPSGVPAAAPAAIFAVCAAFAQLFRSVVLGAGATAHHAWTFSLLDFTPAPALPTELRVPSLDLGRVALLGAGAIGSGFAFSLMLSGWSAELTVIDRDRYDQPNWETTMLISRDDELRRGAKARALADLVGAGNAVRAEHVITDVSADSPVLAHNWDLFVCAVDNPETRRILDGLNVACLVNGGVGGSVRDAGHVLCSRHAPSDVPLSALYPDRGIKPTQRPQDAPTEIRDDCSRIAYQGVSMAAPFLGVASGALLLAVCAQWRLGLDVPANYLKLDLLGQQDRFQRERKRRGAEVCQT